MTPKQWKRLFYRLILWAGALALLLVLFGVGAATWRIFMKGQEAEHLKKSAADNVRELSLQKSAAEEALAKLDTSRGVEEEIRKRYELGKPGEEQFVLVTEENTATSTNKSDKDFWGFISKWFSKN